MKMLTREAFEAAKRYLLTRGRAIDKAWFAL
jgi:hypothetical protein